MKKQKSKWGGYVHIDLDTDVVRDFQEKWAQTDFREVTASQVQDLIDLGCEVGLGTYDGNFQCRLYIVLDGVKWGVSAFAPEVFQAVALLYYKYMVVAKGTLEGLVEEDVGESSPKFG